MTSAHDVLATVLDLPLHRSLGLRAVEPGEPEAGLELDVDDRTVNPGRVLHGGLVPLVLDVTSYLALVPRLPPGSGAVTVSSHVSLLAAVPHGATVRSTASVDRLGRSMAFLSARLLHGERLVATAQVVKALTQPRD